jgi:outer membrane lipoprotein-sorting protein
VENQGEEIVTIYDPKEGSYMYYPKKHTAIKLPTTQASQPPQEIKENFAENPNFSKIGEETLNGQLCDIYESNEAKFWVRRDINFPVKVVYQPGNSSGMSEVEYKNVAVNPKLDDKLFRLPEGTAVSDFAEKLNEQIQKLGDLDVEEVFKKYGQ